MFSRESQMIEENENLFYCLSNVFLSLFMLIGTQCQNNFFDCGNGKCISEIWRCDGNNDCGNLKDEENCDKLCSDSEFPCSSGSCINQDLVCDTHKDCDDGSDEGSHCGRKYNANWFDCGNGKYISEIWHCDGDNDCGNLKDEENCDVCKNSSCSQKCRPTPEGPLCYCNDGYMLNARDNKTCSDIDECQQEGFCSHECINTAGSYKCSCNNGYELVNGTCKATGADPLLIFATLNEIRAKNLRTEENFHIGRALAKASTVDICPKNKRVYWVEISKESSIYSAEIDGSDFRTVLSDGLLIPEDIAVDYIADNLYITDSGLKQVLVCKIDGSMCSILHDQNVGKPRSIALDIAEGYIYWSDWGDQTAGIYRSGMDGSLPIPLISSGIKWPNGIAIDHSTNRLYWVDAKLNTIEYTSLNENSRKIIYNETPSHPYAVTVFEDTIYWTDWAEFSLKSCNKFTGNDVKILEREHGKHIMGTQIYHPLLMAKVSNPCWFTGCSHLCLISPVSGFRCACSYGFQLDEDGKTCIIKGKSESMFVNGGSSIYYIIPNSVGSGTVTEIPLQNNSTISRVSYDRNLHLLFVADTDTPVIYALNTSLHKRVLVKNDLVIPQDLAFDSRSNNLYWIDSGKGTVEVISIDSLKRVVLMEKLEKPSSLAVSPEKGIMFIATIGMHPSLIKCDMDGKNRILLHHINGMPVSLAVHPSKATLYWADQSSETISYIDYDESRFSQILIAEAYDVTSVAASEEDIFWTSTRRELNLRKANISYVIKLPGQGKERLTHRVTYSPATIPEGKSECLIENGGCSYLCLTSPEGRTCACPSESILDYDNVSCVARRCEANDFNCVNGQCIPHIWLCDGRDDCDDGSDEANCTCNKDQIVCSDGACLSMLWRCDGEEDCSDGSDELNCNLTRCDPEYYFRCDNGQCVLISWVCDGSKDCYDSSDEKICTKTCKLDEFKCQSDGSCIHETLKCDGRPQCKDRSDEKNCARNKK